MATATRTERTDRSNAFSALREVLNQLTRRRHEVGAAGFEVSLHSASDRLEGNLMLIQPFSDEYAVQQKNPYSGLSVPVAKVSIRYLSGNYDTLHIEPHNDAIWGHVKLLDDVLSQVLPKAGG